ncbi:hypothetical protein NPL7_00925 [Metamycoplasma hyosynoviae]|uniref:hypothetical protein n=1 Tax=Metamycoplasma hyosynoviae TaxID=29559 RepID=UPI0004612360|nr:hypothetical protein [Metamycoplasma hyosynoviae]KDE42186.1 hypothetical protein NPL3_01775 [Metamycoplasma hyosynoviae]KDE42357.1 hypothetical protein NPL7_00925 [Metamycoplasma hyosynoviae]KDE43972.1 hypothetical protein NPL6_02535 [Metamycoplasma hyosynoviae]KDE44213.1 hypothetical protein NPL5_00045 [Metamycoplasma hyosynoviae]KDE45001.1 hypothetical protein NPL4_02720 [Metamycoplasma hyosynoviae]
MIKKKNLLIISIPLLTSTPLAFSVACKDAKAEQLQKAISAYQTELKVAEQLIQELEDATKYPQLQNDLTMLKKEVEAIKKEFEKAKTSTIELQKLITKIKLKTQATQQKKHEEDSRDKTFDSIDASNSLEIISENASDFYEAIRQGNDFYFDRKAYKLVAVEKGKRPNWTEVQKYLVNVNIKDIASDLQLANHTEPLYGGNKISGKIDYEIKDKEIIFKYRAAFFNGGNPKVSEKLYETNLGEILSQEQLEKLAKLEEAESKTTFEYKGPKQLEETYLSEVKDEEISSKVPEGFEIAKQKIVKNSDVGFYELTILFKLKIKGTDIVSKKNKQFIIIGWKKTPEKIAEEEKAKKEIEEQTKTIKVYVSNEKAYQDIIVRQKPTQENAQPNFVLNGYSNLFHATVVEVKVEDEGGKKKITVTYEIWAKANQSIKIKKQNVNVETNYNNDTTNPHNLTEEEQKKYLEDAIKDVKIIPFYSKDKTYIEKLRNEHLTNKSFFIQGKKYQNLEYQYGNVVKNGEKFEVEVTMSFSYWSQSPKVKVKKEIDLSILGVDEVNKSKPDGNKIQDIEAPSATINDFFEPTLDINKFKDSPEDEYSGNGAIKVIKTNTLDKMKDLVCWSKALYDQMASGDFGEKYLLQNLKYDKDTYEKKDNIYFLQRKGSPKELLGNHYVFIFSKPKYDQNTKELTIKVSVVSVNDLNAGNSVEQVASKRINVKKDIFLNENDTYKTILFSEDVYAKSKFKADEWDKKNKSVDHYTVEVVTKMLQDKLTGYTIFDVKVDHSEKDQGILKYEYTVKNDKFTSYPFKITVKNFKK